MEWRVDTHIELSLQCQYLLTANYKGRLLLQPCLTTENSKGSESIDRQLGRLGPNLSLINHIGF